MDRVPDKLKTVLNLFENIDDIGERIDTLIEYSDKFQEVPPHIARRPFPEEHRVPYCESDAFVWVSEQPDKTLKLYFAVDNPSGLSAKALAVILDETLSGSTVEEIASTSPEIVYSIFGRSLSMGKGHGLMGMVSMIVAEAKRILREKESVHSS